MKTRLMVISAVALSGAALAVEPALRATVTVDPAREIQPIKPMNSVNNGPTVPPVRGDQKRGNFNDYKLARFPMARPRADPQASQPRDRQVRPVQHYSSSVSARYAHA